MAKSARASSIKKNKSGLKKKVFGPVEQARNERLSQKLMELASQPKPPREDMEEDSECRLHQHAEFAFGADADMNPVAENDSAEAKEKGTYVPSLSVAIPASVYSLDSQLPTPPDTPPLDTFQNVPILDLAGQKALAKELFFYHLLGASTDILGFDENGELKLGFGSTAEG